MSVQTADTAVGKSSAPTVDQELLPLPPAYRIVESPVENTQVVRRLSWPMLLMGIFLILISGVMFLLPSSGDTSRASRNSRRYRAVEKALGEETTRVLATMVLFSAGTAVIYFSRREMITGKPVSGVSNPCDLCGKTSSDAAISFATVAGGPDLLTNIIRQLSPAFQRKYGSKDRFPAAFQCHACKSCSQISHRFVWGHRLQAVLLGTAVVAALFAVMSSIAPFIAPPQNLKPVFGTLIAVTWGIVLFHVVIILLLQRYISQGTSRLLGLRVDPIIRQNVGIECWGWRRCVELSQFVPENLTIIDVKQK